MFEFYNTGITHTKHKTIVCSLSLSVATTVYKPGLWNPQLTQQNQIFKSCLYWLTHEGDPSFTYSSNT